MKKSVLFVHDAAIDEYMAGVLLTTVESIEMRGIVIVNADCVAGPAMDAAYKIQQFVGRPEVPLALSRTRAWNAFPWPYRGDCVREGQIDCLRDIAPNPDWPSYPAVGTPPRLDSILDQDRGKVPIDRDEPAYPSGEALLAAELDGAVAAGRRVTLLVCCPLTPVRTVLEEAPERASAIERLVWMGGALSPAQGNLDPKTVPEAIANPYAEWNAFWDPFSVAWVLGHTGFPITLFPLNVTGKARITTDFTSRLQAQAQQYRLSRLASESYALVRNEPFYEMWDVLTSAFLVRPGLFAPPVSTPLSIVTGGYYEGALVRDERAPRSVDVILDLADPGGFYDFVLDALRR